MTGKRKKGNEKLPPYVYFAKGRYEYRNYDGRKYKTFRLCGPEATIGEVWAAYEALAGSPKDTFSWLGRKYLSSPEFAGNAPRTRDDKESLFDVIISRRTRGGTFGDLEIKKITPVVMRRYMDKYGPGREVRANRELAFMSVVFSWGYERGLCTVNPCRGVRKFQEKARSRYVTDDQYSTVYALAAENRGNIPYLPLAMELAFLARMRRVEVLNLIESDIQDGGLLVRRRKGSKTQVVGWTPRLRTAVNTALALPGVARLDPSKRWLIHDMQGNKISEAAFSTAWQRLITLAIDKGLEERFTFHDLKAKGVSDFDGDKKRAGGHRTEKAAEVYDRKPEIIRSTR